MANAKTLTIELDTLPDFKADKDYNKPWTDKGLYIVYSPIKNGFFSIYVTSTGNLTTINPAVRNSAKYEQAFITLVRREDRSFTDYELSWLEAQLFNKLKNTDLDFTCSAPQANPINNDEAKKQELEPVLADILAELKDQGYDLDDYAYYANSATGEVTPQTDSVVVDGVGGFITAKISYVRETGSVSVELKSEMDDELILRSTTQHKA